MPSTPAIVGTGTYVLTQFNPSHRQLRGGERTGGAKANYVYGTYEEGVDILSAVSEGAASNLLRDVGDKRLRDDWPQPGVKRMMPNWTVRDYDLKLKTQLNVQ